MKQRSIIALAMEDILQVASHMLTTSCKSRIASFLHISHESNFSAYHLGQVLQLLSRFNTDLENFEFGLNFDKQTKFHHLFQTSHHD